MQHPPKIRLFLLPLVLMFMGACFAAGAASAQTQSSTQNFYRNLTIGDTGADVSLLQSTLISHGYLAIANPTGYFGAITSAAVAQWQASAGLPSTGYFGPLSRAAIAIFAAAGNSTTTNSTSTMQITNTASTTAVTATTTPSVIYYGGGGGGGGGGGNGSAPQQTTTPPPATPDTTSPTISITSPLSGSTTTDTDAITVTATAADNIGVTRVELYVDGVLAGTTATVPYTITLNPPLSQGAHTLVMKAYDAAGNVGSSASVSISIIAPSPTPTVPTNFSVRIITTSTVTLAWLPSSEPSGTIAGYRLYRNGTSLVTTTANSFTNISLNASTTYSYAISAYDTAGNSSATSSSVTATTRPLAQSSSSISDAFGFSVGESLLGSSSSTLNAALSDMASFGIGRLRFDIEWSHVQPNNSGQYYWGNIDALVAAATAHNIKLLAILDYTPTWAEDPACVSTVAADRCPPASSTQYAAFAQAAVNRYVPEGVTDWEIWNEPNVSGSWQPGADAAAYTALLKSAYTAIKAAQPSAFVITGGLSPAATAGSSISPIDFLTQLYADGAQGYFDAVGDHPYSYPAMPLYEQPWNAWSQMASTTPSLRSIMIANGDADKTIWLTEYGAPTDGPGVLESSATDTTFAGSPDHVTEALQATMLAQAIGAVQQYPWAGPMFIYGYKDYGTDPSTVENFFGIVRNDESTKPAYQMIEGLSL